MSEKPIDPEARTQHLEWTISARCRIQTFMLKLHAFRIKQSYDRSKTQGVYDLLVGSAFSLWRAAFLADSDRDQSCIAEKANDLLMKLLEDNTFGFADERKTRHWTGGYYLNNASFRLRQIINDNQQKKLIELDETSAAIRDFIESEPTVSSNNASAATLKTRPEDLWDLMYNAQDVIFQAISRS